MYILGLHTHHDAGAALIKDGKIIAASDEERFTRVKHWGNGFPVNATKFVLNYAGISLNDIDYVAIPSKYGLGRMVSTAWDNLGRPAYILKLLSMLLTNKAGTSSVETEIRKNIKNIKNKNIYGIEHHQAHAASAFYTSGFKSATAITLDGIGNGLSGSANLADSSGINRIKNIPETGSMGHYYEALTDGLGFSIYNDEYKVMGLASYGNPNIAYKEALKFGPKVDGLKLVGRYWNMYGDWVNNVLRGSIAESAYFRFLSYKYGSKDAAAAGQKAFEDIVLEWLSNVLEKTNNKNLVSAGGCILNVKLNKRIRDEFKVDYFPFPHCGDGGLAIGAALELQHQLKPKTFFPKKEDIYFGIEYSNEQIKNALDKAIKSGKKIKYKECKDISGICGELVAKGKIIGWFQGRAENGPRALGNRSILADSRNEKFRDKVNVAVKFREEWRPFCPSMLDEAKEEYLINPTSSPFMILSFDVPKKKVKEIPAVVHVDGTTRPQTVTRTANQRYYDLIKSYESETGIPVILNTSFNRKGEPIVNSPDNAIDCFLGTALDYLAIGDFLVSRTGSIKYQALT
jgi:carbamoyltransferase